MTPTDALSVRGLSKSFSGVRVLHPLDLAIAPGEVHALVGQNGSGKSTLVKCLTGVHSPDSGTAAVFGKELLFPVHAPAMQGIAVIHQDIGLVEDMTVLENLGINAKYGTRLLAPVSRRSESAIYQQLCDRLEIELPFDAKVSTLSPADHSMIGVVRAMRVMAGHEHQLFILDEPTAHLSHYEAQKITSFMRKVAELQSSVIFISHRLKEVLEYCDSVTVIRDGHLVETRPTDGLTKTELVSSMLGRRMVDFYPAPPELDADPEPVLVIDGLTGRTIRDFNLTVGAGEIVGVTGLAGMGQEEVPRLLSGAESPTAGRVEVDGAPLPFGSPRAVMRRGVALVPSNRQRDGLWMEASAAENATLPVLGTWRRRTGIFDWRSERVTARRILKDAGLRPLEPERQMRTFSGGNQQKVVFGKWLQLSPKVFLLDEPTQGVDAGAGHELLERTVELARSGTAVLVISGDYEQLAAVCHRVVVLHDGQLVAELVGEELSESAILEACQEVVPVETS